VALAGPPAVDELRAALHSVSQENAHLARLTQDLPVLSRARGGALPVRRVEASLPELMADACRRISPRAGDVHLTFTAAEAQVRIDPVWFRQAVDNLVDKAIRHTPAGGRVDVAASRPNGTILLVVDDTGPGFTAAPVSAPFEPFASAGRKQGEGGGIRWPRTRRRPHHRRGSRRQGLGGEPSAGRRPGEHDDGRRVIPGPRLTAARRRSPMAVACQRRGSLSAAGQ
jgi:signal transduction histidine kinase